MPFFVPLVAAAVGGLASAISGDQQKRQARRNIEESIGLLRDDMLTTEEIDELIRDNTRSFNVSLGNLMNTTAIRSRGITNAPVVGAAIAANVEAQKLQSNLNIKESALDRNSEIRHQIANLKANIPSDDIVGDAFTGAITGLTAGMEFEKMFTKAKLSSGGSKGSIGTIKLPGIDNADDFAQVSNTYSNLFKYTLPK